MKDAAPAELLDGIQRAAAGDSPFSPAILRRVVSRAIKSRMDTRRPETRQPDVTPREREVLTLVGAGLSNGEIADRLHVGVTTVKTHIASLMTKTGSPNRIRLAVLATRTGLV